MIAKHFLLLKNNSENMIMYIKRDEKLCKITFPQLNKRKNFTNTSWKESSIASLFLFSMLRKFYLKCQHLISFFLSYARLLIYTPASKMPFLSNAR